MINIIVSIKDNLNNEEYRDIIRKIMNIKGIVIYINLLPIRPLIYYY